MRGRFVREANLLDYSLLCGVHYPAREDEGDFASVAEGEVEVEQIGINMIGIPRVDIGSGADQVVAHYNLTHTLTCVAHNGLQISCRRYLHEPTSRALTLAFL